MALEKIGTVVQQGLTSVCLSGATVYMQKAWNLPGVKTGASAIFALYALSQVNNVLNNLAWDNYTEPKPWDWRREIVLVTGGCSGLGEATTRKLAQRGITVVVLDIQQPKKSLPPGVHFYQCDVSSEEEVKKTGAAVRRDVGAPTVLVNNAGIASWSTILEDTPERLQRLFGVNVFAHFHLVREFLPDMVRNDHGHVVTISSVSSQVTIAGLTDYSCTKAATISFHEGLRQDLKHKYNAPHVRTSIVFPCWTLTNMLIGEVDVDNFGEALIDPETVADAIAGAVLSGQSCDNVSIPGYMRYFPLLRFLPQWVSEYARYSRRNLLPWNSERLAKALGKQ